MKAFELAELLNERDDKNVAYLEFLKVPDLSCGIYFLPAGGVDGQQPHSEDEVYYIISGRGMIMVDGEHRPVQPGSTVYVAKHIDHRFHTIEEDLTILVFFAPAES